MTPFLEAAIAAMLPQADPVDGCAECGFDWSAAPDEAVDHVSGAATRFAELLDGRDASHLPAPDVWTPSAYVWHVADVVRAWAERLHTLGVDADAPWAAFDPDELASARRYGELPAVSGPWAVGRAADALMHALEPLDPDVTFVHPEWGPGTVADALRWVAHEIVHHDLDVRRGLGLAGEPPA